MNIQRIKSVCWMVFFSLAFMFYMSGKAWATIDGVTGSNFNFTAKSGLITTPDGDSLLLWGYALGNGPMQYPGPTLIVNQGDSVTITLTNELGVPNMPVSIVFPGQEGVV